MLFTVQFEDNPDADPNIRRDHMPAHLAFLERHCALIQAAGPLEGGDGGVAGGMWLVEADARGTVENLIENDPLWSTGLRKSVRVLRWRQVFADGGPVGQS